MIPAPPRPRELSLEERLERRLSGGLVRTNDSRWAKRNLADSDKRLRQSGRSSSALEAEAQALVEAGQARIRHLDYDDPKKSVLEQSHRRIYFPDDLFANPFDLVYARVQQIKSQPPSNFSKTYGTASDGRALRAASLDWLGSAPEFAAAAALRLEAFASSGLHSYPVAACPRCQRLTGWLSAGDRPWCDYCLWASQAACYASEIDAFDHWPHRDAFFQLAERYNHAAASEYGQAREPIGSGFWSRKRRQQARLLLWGQTLFDLLPNTGPATPEEGYELWLPERFEIDAVDGSDVLVHFWATRYRWQGAGFKRLPVKLKQASIEVPSCFSAALEPEQLASAWVDFRLLVAERNQADYQGRLSSESVAADRALAREQQRALLDSRRGAAAILER